jgi:hypothetical protein
MTTKSTTKKNPRISVNKLAEYVDANPTRRKQIVRDAKYPAKYIVTRYSDAREAIKEYIKSGMDDAILLNAIEKIKSKKPDTDFQAQDNALSIEMLEIVMVSDLSPLEGFDYGNPPENKIITIGEVDVSVNPDLLVVDKVGGAVNVGGLKFNTSRSVKLTDESLKVVAAINHKYISENIVTGTDVANNKMSFSYDVFGERTESCPSGYAVRMKRVEAACEEIAMWWDKL